VLLRIAVVSAFRKIVFDFAGACMMALIALRSPLILCGFLFCFFVGGEGSVISSSLVLDGIILAGKFSFSVLDDSPVLKRIGVV